MNNYQKVKNNIYVEVDGEFYMVGVLKERSISWVHFGKSYLSDIQKNNILTNIFNV